MFYESIAQFTKQLENLDRWLTKAEAYAQQKSFDTSVLVSARLAPDQYPFARQVQAACDAAKFAAARLSGREPPRHEDNEKTFEELHARIASTVAFLKTFSPADFEGAATRVVALPWMPGKGVRGTNYLAELAGPNFAFHVTTAYSILRHNGVDLGKADFIGSLPLVDL